jgi:23S rRNA (cytosine1962-C5)-methyltransferase
MATLILQNRSRVFHGHHWVSSADVKTASYDPQPGDVVNLKDQRGRMLGCAIYNPHSNIVARRFSYRKQELDEIFFTGRVNRAIEHRKAAGVDLGLCRLLWSESDGVPGLIVDKYGDHLVVQTLTFAMAQREDIIRDVLVRAFSPASITTRNEVNVRLAEKLPQEKKVLHGGTAPAPFTLKHAGMAFQIDVVDGQKTGIYMDQLDNYVKAGALAQGRRVLDVFCNQGGFAQACALAGAAAVTAVDVSEPAIAQLQRNASAAGVQIEGIAANAFDYLKAAEQRGDKYDMIILDPPSFTKNRDSVKDAKRGYKELHLRALKMLEPGGHMLTYSCSHHVSTGDFMETINDAAVDAKKTLRITDRYFQRADHPVLVGLPETEYLRGYALEVVAAW